VKVADGARTVMEVVRALDSEQLQPTDFAVREPTLDDVFLELTGTRIRNDDEVKIEEVA
jgi:hypothetical protein